jgi:hypothetical protein
MLATHSGQHVKAEETLQEGLALAREMGHRESIMLHLINLGAGDRKGQSAAGGTISAGAGQTRAPSDIASASAPP